jgi:hypothetical protein
MFASSRRAEIHHIGVGMFATDYAIPMDELAQETEARLRVAVGSQHTHIPTSRRTHGRVAVIPWNTAAHDPFIS